MWKLDRNLQEHVEIHQLPLMQVYKGRLDEVKDVAVKFFDRAQIDEHAQQRFTAEVSLLRAMRDANIVSCMGAWLQADLAFMVRSCACCNEPPVATSSMCWILFRSGQDICLTSVTDWLACMRGAWRSRHYAPAY